MHLTPKEGDTLAALLMNRGRLLSRTNLIEAVYPDPDKEPDWAMTLITIVITRLRRKLPDLIQTECSRGYYIERPRFN